LSDLATYYLRPVTYNSSWLKPKGFYVVDGLGDILRAVAREHGVTSADLRSDSRHKYLVLARREYIRRAHATGRYSDGKIGKLINRTSWTVLYHRNARA